MASPQEIIEGVIEVENTVGDFIRNGPSDGLPGYVRDQYRKRCEQYSNAPAWARGLANLPSGSLGRICKPYLDDSGYDLPERKTPFTGGQCPGVRYRYQYAIVQENGSVGVNNVVPCSANRFGPISTSKTESGGIISLSVTSSDINGVVTTSIVASSNSDISLQFSIISRCDGMPDACGDPDPTLEPGPNPAPDPGPTPGPEPTGDPRNPSGPPIIPIPPYDDPLGGPTPIETPGGDPGGGGGEPEPAPSTGPNENGPGDEGAVGDGSPPGEDGDFGEPPEGRVWIGAFVRFDVPPQTGNIPSANPDNPAYATVVGNVCLDHGAAFSAATQARSRWVGSFRENPNLTVKGCRVNSRTGVSFQVFPVSAETCPENQCKKEEEPVNG